MSCQHLTAITLETLIHKSNYPVFRCEECVRIGGTWVHLRICQTCGKMLCCDSSEHQHARHHFQASGHPVISSAELGEQWLYCYEDQDQKRY